MLSSLRFVEKCLEESGDRYTFGAENQPGLAPGETTEWDCSELVQVKLNEMGIDAPDGSAAQLEWCRSKGSLVPLAEGKKTRGALLLREGHVAVSLGDGTTIEARGSEYGVGVFSSADRGFTHAALVPGLQYGPESSIQDTSIESGGDRRKVLQIGSEGGSVVFVQKRLTRLGYGTGPADGIFGPLTESAVKAFQTDKGMRATGIVDQQTWLKLSPVRRNRRQLKKRRGRAG